MNKYQLSEGLNLNLTEFFKILADQTRLKIVYALTQGELCVQDISNVVKMSQTAVSYQLRILRGARVVRFRRDGKMIYYSIDDGHVDGIIKLTIEHLTHEEGDYGD